VPLYRRQVRIEILPSFRGVRVKDSDIGRFSPRRLAEGDGPTLFSSQPNGTRDHVFRHAPHGFFGRFVPVISHTRIAP
jgi:hypothetical protein